jgi:subtilisin family serine protease
MRLGTGPSVSEEATPDCDIPPPQPFPGRQRLRQLARLGADCWHRAGYLGQGITIAILDTGFRGYRAQLGRALPANVRVRSFRGDGNFEARDSQHGILCAEVMHALAPLAKLILANWDPDQPDEFLEAARWARRQGARIISCSVIMPSWSDGEGGGRVDQTLAAILGRGGPGDLLCFASAGNTAQRHWSGTYHEGADGFHEWRPGQSRNVLSPWTTAEVAVELYWRGSARYALVVTNDRTGRPTGPAPYCQYENGRSCTVVHFTPQRGATYTVRVRRSGGSGGDFHLVALGGALSLPRAGGSVACPADCPVVQAVGAVHADGQRASYSSCGPNSPRPKPDFVAPVPFASLWRSRPFTGTSAAAPQAAGLAALCWSRHPDWTAAQVRQALRAAALDLGPPGHDCETGYGMIRLPELPAIRAGLREPALLRP